jgi:outer membrane protein TolC
MARWGVLFIFCVTSFINTYSFSDTVFAAEVFSDPAPTTYQDPDAPYLLADLAYEVYPTFSRVILASNDVIDFITYELQNPRRIVIDLVGTIFCELEEHAEYDQGLVQSIDVITTPYAQRPEGLDKYFYPADYIIITPQPDASYTATAAEGGKVVVVDIGEKEAPELKISKAAPIEEIETEELEELTEEAEEEPEEIEIEEEELIGEGPVEEDITEVAEGPQAEEPPPIAKKAVIDDIYYEALLDSSLMIVSSTEPVEFEVEKKYLPYFRLILKPKAKVFTELQERIKFEGGFLDYIRIKRDKAVKRPAYLDEYFYAVKYIEVIPVKKYPFDFYSNEDNTVSIIEVPATKPKIDQEPAPVEEEEGPLTREEIMRAVKEEIKKEEFLKEERIKELRRQEEEKRRREAELMTEQISRQVLEDLVIKGEGILTLERAQDIAFKNSQQAKTAREEARLAKLKMNEALRALFPQLKIKGSHTSGQVIDADFIEELYGVQIEQPIYQGTKLYNTYKQARVNVKLAKARHQKIENDLDYKVAEAYYSTVTSMMNIRLQEELLKEAKQVLEAAEARRASGLSTDLEILNVRSQYNQIQFQIASSERDLALSRFKLYQAMGLDISKEKADLSEVDTDLEFKSLDVDLYKCLELASEYQPDILVNELLVKAKRYDEKIARAKGSLKVDFTGFYGRSGSHYETEARDLSQDWNVGLKVSRPFWGNTASYSFTKEETDIKPGQTDRTSSTVHSGEFAIMDALSVASDTKEAKVNRKKAENDLIEARRSTSLEVKEAYYNYQESIIQVKNTLEKVKFQEEAVKVARAQAGLNEALQSQLLEAIVKLADEKSVYIKALSDFNLSIVKLNKAIGIKNYFSIDIA